MVQGSRRRLNPRMLNRQTLNRPTLNPGSLNRPTLIRRMLKFSNSESPEYQLHHFYLPNSIILKMHSTSCSNPLNKNPNVGPDPKSAWVELRRTELS